MPGIFDGDGLNRRTFMAANLACAAALAAPTSARAETLAATPPTGDWDACGLVDRGGGCIQWASIGPAKAPVVLMMPKLGGWIADWRYVARAMAGRFRVIVVDPPGHGGSRMATPPPYIQTLPESASMIRAALGVLGIERYSIVGNSLGGCIGAIMAALFPDDVENLALVSVALADRFTSAQLAAYDARTAGYDTRGYPLPRSDETMATRFGTTSEINHELNTSRAAAGLWIRPSERGVFTCGITDFLPRIAARTLLVYGKGNEGVYQVYRDKALRLIPHSRSVEIEGAGAFLHQQRPAETASLLDTFLSGG